MRRQSYSPRAAGAALALVLPLAGAAIAQQSVNETTTLDPLVVSSGIPVPLVGPGAPNFTPEEIRQKGQLARTNRETFEDGRATLYQCYLTVFGVGPNPDRMVAYDAGADAARRISTWSRLADEATVALRTVRIEAAGGSKTLADVEKAELDRQRAVNEMVKAEADFEEARLEAIDLQQLVKDRVEPTGWMSVVLANAAERAGRKWAMVPKEFEDLRLEGIVAAERHDDKGEPYLYVTGSIRNTHKTRITIPPLSVTAVDQWGYPLQVERAEARGRIDPGKTQTFTYSLKPSPPHTTRVTVTFAGLATESTLEPVEADPVCQYKPAQPYQVKGARASGDQVPEDIAAFDPRLLGGAHATPSGRVDIRGTSKSE